MHIKFYTLICSAALLAACATYTPDPVDFDRDGTEWFMVSTRLCPPNSSISRGSMRSIGLLLNPALNKARLSYAAETEASRFAGLWEDPSLSVEGVRVLRENFNNNSIGPSLSIPVTGLPSLAKKVAEQYNEADYWSMRAQERAFLTDLEVLRYNILVIHDKLSLIRARLNQVKVEKKDIDRLYKLGEVELSDYQASCQRFNDTMKECQELENEHLAKRHELIAQMGLHPAVGSIELEGKLPGGVPSLVRPPSVAQLLESPELHSMLAAYGASETELRTEIRKQYPELSIGPSLTREEGNNKIGIGLEMNLPIWNRNRMGIAKASGARDLKHHDTIALWRKLQQDVSALNARQKLAAEHCRTEMERMLALQETGKQQEELYKLGETSLPALADARHEIFQRRMSYLDCLGTLLEIQTKLQYINPYYQP
ncbi:MAG: TolC family protein [Akkermansia sp.]|nr:TolC family protein [Akkermansia sp.]